MRTRIAKRFASWLSVLLLLLYLPACASFNELTGPTAVPGVVASVEVTNAQPQLAVGASLPLQALIRDANGNAVVDRTITWSTSDVKIATVSAEGVVTGIAIGTVKIAASVQGRSATATLNITSRPVASILVNPPSPTVLVGGQLQLTSVTLGESGDVLAGRNVFWSTSNPLVASIDNTGMLTGLAPGATTITATSENRSASAGVTVLQVPVATVQVSPAVDTVVVGQTTQLTAVARDSIGTPLADRPIAWSSSSSASASVSASGLVVGTAAGTVTITASSEGKSGTARIVVLPRPVGSVIVSPAQMAITAGQSVKLTVLITDNSGTLLTGRPIQYQSGNTSIATVASDGTVLGVNAGSTTITVSSEGRTGTANVVVSASPVASLRVNLAAPELSIGATQKVTATLLDANNNVLPPRPITWTSGAPSVASVAADGTVSALSAGTAVIFASVEGKLASATLIVRQITVVSVVVAPPTANLFVGDAVDLGAQARDVSGAVVAGRTVLWRSSDDRVAVVSSTGRVRALAVGQVLITASVDGIEGSSAITTTVEPVLTVTVDPPTLSMLPATSTTIVPTARGRNGVALTGKTFTFLSLDPSIATVNQNGLVNALRTGNTSITVTSEGKQVSVPVVVSPAPVATVSVTLANPSRLVSQTTQATAIPRDGGGAALTGRPVVWTSSDVAVATVNAAGVVTAVGPGTANIIATVEGKAGQASITVALVPVANVTASLAQSARFVGQTTQATAVTTDSIGGVLTGRPIVWTTSNASVATVSASGLVTAVAAGSANIIATSEGKSGSAAITVSPVPVAKVAVTLVAPDRFVAQSTQATAVLTDANGNVLTGRAIAWSSSDPLIATVSASGLVTALLPGTAQITATSEGIAGSAPVRVTPAPVAAVTVTLANPNRYVTQTTQATAVLRDALGNVLTGRAIVWSSSDPVVATVSASGLVTAVSPNVGPTTIIATSEGVQGAAPITVSLVPVSSVTVSIAQPGLQPGQTTQATAVTLDSINGVLTGRAITWQSSNTSVATVSSTGLITAVAQGNATITATSEGKSGVAPVTVTLIPVASVSVSIDKSSLLVAQKAQVTSVTRDAAGNILTGRLTAWSSSNVNVATVTAAGVVTAVGAGSVTIIGTSEAVQGSVQLSVALAPVASVAVAVNTTSLLVGQTTQATAITSDAASNIVTGRAVVFSSSNTNVATVDQAGVVTAVGAGAVNIIATSEGQSGFVTITVSTVPVNSVSLALAGTAPNNFYVGATNQATATTRDANGGLLPGRLVTWTSTNTSVATVNSAGLITMVAAGTAEIIAQSEGKSAQVAIIVTNAPVANVAVSLVSSSLFPLQSTQATAVLRDVNGRVLTGRSIVWSTSNALVALVSQNGVVTAVLPGSATITATSEGVPGTASLTVNIIPVASVTTTLSPSNVIAGQTSQATAVPRDASGNALTGRTISWTTSNGAVATVNASGLVTSIAPGTADIIATSEGRSGFATLTVSQVPVATVSVALVPAAVVVGQTSQGTATTRDASNNVLTGRPVTWQSSNTAVATVNASGVVTAVAPGSADITASSEGKSGVATLTVTAVPVATVSVSLSGNGNSFVAGSTVQATATTRDANGVVLGGRPITWSSSNTSIATVSASGLVTTISAGPVDIVAESEGKTGKVTISVLARPVATVTVALNPTSVIAGQTSQATATTLDQQNNVLNGRAITWQSSNTSVATVNASGLVTSVAPGTADITATSEGKSGSATLTVTAPPPAPVATVSVVVAPTSVVAGQTSQATATTRDAGNNVLTGRLVTWQSSNTSVATVNASGLVTTLAAGTVDITATSEGKTGFATLTVTAPPPVPVATVSVVVAPTSVVAGQTSQATATTRDAGNNVLTGRLVTWQSSNTSIATVNAGGLVTTLAAGTVDITATSEGKTGFATLTVTAPPPVPVATVSVVVAPTSVVAGQTSQATATTRDAGNNVLTGRLVTWQSSNTSIATVNAGGLVTTLAAGTVDITATSEGKTGFATLTVTAPPPAPVATVSVVVAPTSVVAGQTSQATATTRDAGNNVLTGRVVTWQSSNTAVATVNASGLVTTLTAGTTNITATSEGQSGFATLTVTAPPPVPVATVSVVVAPTSVVAGQTSQATATTRDAGNNVLTGRVITWQSSNTAVATVDANGLVTTLTAGTANITATSEGQSGFATLTVTAPPPAPVATVSVVVAPTSVVAGQTSQATATTRDAGNNVLTGRVITWQSSNTAVATVDANGLVTTLTAGTANITATSEGQSGFATLTVTAPPPVPVATVSVVVAPTSVVAGQTSQATATTRDAGNNVLTGRVVTWQSSNTAVATVDANGLVTTLTAGTANITATSEGQSGFATLTVTAPPPAPVATVSVVVAPTSVVAGQTSQATATTRDAGNNVLTGRVITWQSSNTAVATVDANGLVTTLTAGTANITATSEGQSGFATLTVTAPPPVPVATVSVVVAPTSVVAGQTSQATATTRDAGNNVLTGRVVTWQSSNTAVATVDANGLITTLTAGTANITATSEGQSGFATLTVTAPPPAPVATVSVVVAPTSVVAGQTSQATATTRDASNNVLTGRVITWQSSNTAVATVDANGLVTTLTAGTANITATSEGQSGFATLTVTAPPPAPVATVSVVVAPTSVVAGQTSQATATTRDAGNNVLTGRVITWQSSNTAVATVDANGLVTTLTAGTANITATSEGQSGFATLTVTAPPPAPVATVSVVVAPTSVVAGQTSQATATTRDAGNNVLTGRVISWQSSNTAVATVDANGLVTTLTAGTANITATSEGQSGFATLTVTAPPPAPVATVSVVLNPATVTVGQSSQAGAVTRDAQNNVLNGRPITWQSSNTSIATINGVGTITTLAAGTVDIIATSEGKTGSATLTVNAPTGGVMTVTVALSPQSVSVGQNAQATAIPRDANGNVVNVNNVQWDSSDQNVARVNNNGLITTLRVGTTDITAKAQGKTGSATLTVTSMAEIDFSALSAVSSTHQDTATLAYADAEPGERKVPTVPQP